MGCNHCVGMRQRSDISSCPSKLRSVKESALREKQQRMTFLNMLEAMMWYHDSTLTSTAVIAKKERSPMSDSTPQFCSIQAVLSRVLLEQEYDGKHMHIHPSTYS